MSRDRPHDLSHRGIASIRRGLCCRPLAGPAISFMRSRRRGVGGPAQDVQGRPLLLPAGRLGLIDVTGCQHRVGPDGEVEHVSQPVRGVHQPPPAGLKAYAQACGGGLEGVDRRLGCVGGAAQSGGSARSARDEGRLRIVSGNSRAMPRRAPNQVARRLGRSWTWWRAVDPVRARRGLTGQPG
jgi:hypothetical protein